MSERDWSKATDEEVEEGTEDGDEGAMIENGMRLIRERDQARRDLEAALKALEAMDRGTYATGKLDRCNECGWYTPSKNPQCRSCIARRTLSSLRGAPDVHIAVGPEAVEEVLAADAAAVDPLAGVQVQARPGGDGALAPVPARLGGSSDKRASGAGGSTPHGEPTGMKPGQRCTAKAGHLHSSLTEGRGVSHLWRKRTEDWWTRQHRSVERCPYVEPPAGPVCASCGGDGLFFCGDVCRATSGGHECETCKGTGKAVPHGT